MFTFNNLKPQKRMEYDAADKTKTNQLSEGHEEKPAVSLCKTESPKSNDCHTVWSRRMNYCGAVVRSDQPPPVNRF